MLDFIKKNMVWIAVVLCVIGIVLSIVGIPTKQPIFFFVGIVFALPTIAYIIYQVFFDKGKAEINLQTNGHKPSNGSVTTVITKKENLILMNNQNSEEEDLEALYDGCATEPEIAMQLDDIIKAEREKAIDATPATVLPVTDPAPTYDETAVQTATQGELFRQRELHSSFDNNWNDTTFTSASEPEPAPTPVAETVTQPVTQPTPVMSPLANEAETVIRITVANAEAKKQRAAEKKALLQQSNLEKYLQRYFIETAVCFVLNRNIYKDKCGIAPYNMFTKNKITELPEYTMSMTKGRLYRFCTYLIDTERFIKHPELYRDFTTAIEQGVPLARVSETLHPIYRKKYKKDFVLNLSNREDWDNVMILVYNNYLLNNDNFKDVFIRVPFEIPVAYNEQNITDYLADPDVQDRFIERYPALAEMGFPTPWEAIFICFVNTVKQKLNIEQLESAILKDYKKIARALIRRDKIRQKELKKAS